MHNIFHEHLDVCDQCRENPMALCEDGATILQAAVSAMKAGHVLAGTRAAVGELLMTRDVCRSSDNDAVRAFGELIDLRVATIVSGENLPILANDDQIAQFKRDHQAH